MTLLSKQLVSMIKLLRLISGIRSSTGAVTWLVLVLELVEVLGGGGGPAQAHAVSLSQADGKHERLPEDGALGLDLLEVGDGSTCIPQVAFSFSSLAVFSLVH